MDSKPSIKTLSKEKKKTGSNYKSKQKEKKEFSMVQQHIVYPESNTEERNGEEGRVAIDKDDSESDSSGDDYY